MLDPEDQAVDRRRIPAMRKIRIIIAALLSTLVARAQEDLLAMIDTVKPAKEFVTATFKGTRLINLHTIEVPGKNSLEFRISHHFGDFNSGGYNFWGLDGGATIRLGLEYSKDGRFNFGIGRSSLDKMFDGFLKYKFIRQAKRNGSPVTVTLFSGIYYTIIKDPNKLAGGIDRYQFESSRFSYCHQVIVARKFSERLSLQLAPAVVHYNLVDLAVDPNDLYTLSFAGRYKFTKRFAMTFEYCYRVNAPRDNRFFDAAGIGFDLETGGHVFQVYLTNSAGMTEPQFFGRTSSDWQTWGIKLGFNISRMFWVGGRSDD
jgi:hypothetical protein